MRWITSAAAGVLLIAGAATTHAQQVDAVRWPVPMAFGSNLVALGDAMPWVAQQLDKMSAGRIKLQVFEPGKLVPALAVFELGVGRKIRSRLYLDGLRGWQGAGRGIVRRRAVRHGIA